MAFTPVITKWNTRTKANGTQMSLSLQQCEDNDNYLLGLTTSLATDIYNGDQNLQGEIDDLNEEITALSIDDQYSVFTASSAGAYSFKIATAMKTNVPTTYSTILNYEIITNFLGRITGAWGMRNHTVYVNIFQIDDLYTDVTMNKTFLYEFADRWELWGLTTSNFSGAMVIRPANNLSVAASLHKNVWVFPGKVSNESSPSAYSEANPTGYTGRNFIDYTSSSYDNRRVSTWTAESTDDHKAMCSIGDVPGYLQDKLVGSDWIDATEIPLSSDEKNIKFALKNPDYFVKGATIYGGTILPATTGDFNSPTHDGYFTGYYNTLNAPPVQTGNPSWFVHHMNSNAGTAYAVQIAYAYTSTIICYERTKVAGVWQAWTLRSAGGVSDGKILISATDTTRGFIYNKITSNTLTIEYSIDSETGNEKLEMNVTDSTSGYPITYEPFFPFASLVSIGANMYNTIGSRYLTRGWSFCAPRSMKASAIGIYMQGEPSPSGVVHIQLSIRDCSTTTVVSTADLIINTTNFSGISAGRIFFIPLSAVIELTGGLFYTIYLSLGTSEGSTMSNVSNLNFAEITGRLSDHPQITNSVYAQYSSQNFNGYTDTGYSDTSYRPFMLIQE